MPNWMREIKWFIQRGRRGWADCDVWNFDFYLSGVIIGGIDWLKEHKHGCPGDMWDETRKNDECWRWSECLEEMRQAFVMIKEDSWANWSLKRINGENKLDKEHLAQHRAKIERGLALFAKHFESLWD